ncbi:MAG TPA: glycosyltransferase, partial [Kofleriaceae bacterium]|nr:glycosyltransferase [Kofleriaceae bacterium]
IESMASGTPVVAYRGGSVEEVIDEGVTGFVRDDIEGSVEAVARSASLSRAGCRARFEERFTAARMAEQYVAAYRRLLEQFDAAQEHAAS